MQLLSSNADLTENRQTHYKINSVTLPLYKTAIAVKAMHKRWCIYRRTRL